MFLLVSSGTGAYGGPRGAQWVCGCSSGGSRPSRQAVLADLHWLRLLCLLWLCPSSHSQDLVLVTHEGQRKGGRRFLHNRKLTVPAAPVWSCLAAVAPRRPELDSGRLACLPLAGHTCVASFLSDRCCWVAPLQQGACSGCWASELCPGAHALGSHQLPAAPLLAHFCPLLTSQLATPSALRAHRNHSHAPACWPDGLGEP